MSVPNIIDELRSHLALGVTQLDAVAQFASEGRMDEAGRVMGAFQDTLRHINGVTPNVWTAPRPQLVQDGPREAIQA